MKILLVDIGNSNTDVLTKHVPDTFHPNMVAGMPIEQSDLSSIKTQELLQKETSTPVINQWLSAHDAIFVSSVVPKASEELAKACKAFNMTNNTAKTCHIFSPHQLATMPDLGLSINLKNTDQVGVDRLFASLGAQIIYKRSCLVVDSGTALTFCLIDEARHYQGGNIFPGMKIGSLALNQFTAKIPLIHVKKMPNLVGKNTQEAVEIGLYRGYIHLINGMIKDYLNQHKQLVVIGTGNGLHVLKDELNIDHWNPHLIFTGLLYVACTLLNSQ